MEVEKYKIDKKSVSESISTLKTETLSSDRGDKQALEDVNERQKLSLITQKVKNKAELNKL